MNDRERIGKRIAELRKESGYSQEKLSELSGVGVAHIGRIELGRYNVGVETLSKIAAVFGMDVDFCKK
jgi:transcriptional regulator with XRE-family HTH domain